MNTTQMICNASNAAFYMIPPFVGTIYHYCPDEATESILTNSMLRFTDRRFQTDTDEAVFPLTVCHDNAEKIVDISYFSDLSVGEKFLKCFKEECKDRIKKPYSNGFYTFQSCYTTTTNCDDLWREFAPKGGYCLKYSSDDLVASIKPQNKSREQRITCGLVIYDEDKQISLMRNLVSGFLTPALNSHIERHFRCYDNPTFHKRIIDRIMFLGTFMVKPKYKSEFEFKIVLDLYKDSDESEFSAIYNEEKTFIRGAKSEQVPYVDIFFEPSALKGIFVEKYEELSERKQDLLRWGKDKFSDVLDKISIDVDAHAFSCF